MLLLGKLPNMDLKIKKVNLQDILPLRTLFLQENNFQIRYNACHERRWTDSFIIKINGTCAGYGSVKGMEDLSKRDAIFEFYLIPEWRGSSSAIFEKLIRISGATHVECQTNDLFLSSMLFEFTHHISSDVLLFKDGPVTNFAISGAVFRKRAFDDTLFNHKDRESDSDYVLELAGEIVATGGFLLHYNTPFADLYMEVREDQRHKGCGSLMIQELKKACYRTGHVPAARCNITNKASKATLLKGGLSIAGYLLSGQINPGYL
jgi:GNAT superfamily N-acetyltransferase